MRAYKEKNGTDMDGDDEKKLRRQTIAKYRAAMGSGKKNVLIEINDREWEAIQNHAISYSKMKEILNNVDMDKVKERAIPRGNGSQIPASKIASIKRMSANPNNSLADIAEALGVSPSTVKKYAVSAK